MMRFTEMPQQRPYWVGYTVLDQTCYGWPTAFPSGYGFDGPPGQVTPVPLPPVPGEEPAPGQVTPVPQPGPGVPPPDPLPLQANPAQWWSQGQISDTEFVSAQPQQRRRRGPRQGWQFRQAYEDVYPSVFPTLHASNYPTPGMFFDADNPQGRFVFENPEDLYRAALGSALAMADGDRSLATSRHGAPLRKDLADLMASGHYNDGLFGTSSVGLAGGRPWIGPHGRGINWAPHHGPVRQSIARAEVPYRTTNIDGSRLSEHIESHNRPIPWIPAIDLDVLREEHQVVPMQWRNGTSTIEPPPVIEKLGVELSGVRFPGGVGYAGHGYEPSRRGSARQWWESRG